MSASHCCNRARTFGRFLVFAFVVSVIFSTSAVAQETGSPWEVPVNTGVSEEAAVDPGFGAATQLDSPAAVESAEGQTVSSRRLLEVIRSGGPLMIPIGVCSFILVVFVFERMISLRRGRIIPGAFARRFVDQLKEGELNRDAATTLCNRDNSPLAQVFLAGISKWGRPAVEVEQAVIDAGERNSNYMRRYLRLINGIATLCPLFGLLGTVLGMITAFDAMATMSSSVADPKTMFATGIGSALLTTAAGLTVAIPALIAYLFFTSRVDRHVMEIDHLAQKVVNHISAEALVTTAKPKSRKKAA
ncbi:MAG: MotA/TolQ/ExbB proton channel family protein [Planctomycetota bacterium]